MRQDGVDRKDGRSMDRGVYGRSRVGAHHSTGPSASAGRPLAQTPHSDGSSSGPPTPPSIPVTAPPPVAVRSLRMVNVGLLCRVRIEGVAVRHLASDLKDAPSASRSPSTTGPGPSASAIKVAVRCRPNS